MLPWTRQLVAMEMNPPNVTMETITGCHAVLPWKPWLVVIETGGGGREREREREREDWLTSNDVEFRANGSRAADELLRQELSLVHAVHDFADLDLL